MDKIRKFDEEFKNTYEDAFLFSKVGGGILCGIGLMFMMVPIGVLDDMIGLMGVGCFVCAMGVMQYIQAYLHVKEKNGTVTIYKKLQYMPVTRAQIRKERCRYLSEICIRVGFAAFVIQQLMSLLTQSFGWKSILFAAIWGLCVWLINWTILYI